MKTVSFDESEWQLVPVEATEEMLEAGFHAIEIGGGVTEQAWAALLAAAPTPADLDGPEFSDGCEKEGFPGGCERMGCCKPTPAEAPADVARDAARLDWLVERNAPHGLGWEIIQMPAGNVHIHTLFGDKAKFGSIRDAIDAAMSEKGQQT